jgi:hypothetical protein
VEEFPFPEIAPDEAVIAVMASSINFNTVWTSIFEPLPTFGFLKRLGKESAWAARHDQPFHVMGSDAAAVVLRVGSAVRNWKPGDAVTRFPVAHRGTDLEHHATGVAAEHVEGLVVTRAPHALLAEPLQEPERRERFEDRRPHGVEVDRARHDRDHGLVGCDLGEWEVLDPHGLARVLLLLRHPVEHVLVLGAHERAPGRLGQREGTELVAGRAFEDRGADGIDRSRHGRRP